MHAEYCVEFQLIIGESLNRKLYSRNYNNTVEIIRNSENWSL